MKTKTLELKLVYNDEETLLYKVFMWLIGIFTSEELNSLANSLKYYVEESE